MTQSEGIVTSTAGDSKAQVVIRNGEPGPPCQDHTEGCFCSGGANIMTVKATNTAGASVGDLVSVSFKPGAMLKSLLVLLGIPTTGFVSALLIGLILKQNFGFEPGFVYLFASVGLLVGVAFSVGTYRRVSDDIKPFISHVIRSHLQPALFSRTIDPVCKREIDSLKAAAQLQYQDRAYHFCQPDCLEAFLKDPANYVSEVSKSEFSEVN